MLKVLITLHEGSAVDVSVQKYLERGGWIGYWAVKQGGEKFRRPHTEMEAFKRPLEGV